MKNILVLTDFSKASDAAFRYSCQYARETKCQLIMMHCLDELNILKIPSISGTNEDRNDKYDRALSFNPYVIKCESEHIPYQIYIGKEDIVKAVSKLIEQVPIQLIVMGSEGIGKTKDFWGSTTKLIVNNINASTLVIKNPTDYNHMDNVVFGSNYDTEDKDDFVKSLKLLNIPKNATIHLLSIDTDSFFIQPTILMKESMRDYAELSGGRLTKIAFYSDSSIPAGVRHYIEENKTDLLIMAKHEKNILSRWLTSDHINYLIPRINTPILISKFS